MAIPQDKKELLSAIAVHYKKLTDELAGIPLGLTTQPTLEGHAQNTSMSINNLVAYLVGWGELVLKWHARKNAGLVVAFPEVGYKWTELGQLAQKFYSDYASDDFATLQTKLAQTTADLLKLIESKSNEELYGVAWYEKWTLGRMIQLNTAAPFKNARDRIRRWKKAQGLGS